MVSKILQLSPGVFRFLLAVIVMIYHSVGFLTIGHYAVYVFFILSGFWIFKMYNEKYMNFHNSYWVYLESRIFRVAPIYFLILSFTILVYFIIPELNYKLDSGTYSKIKSVLKNYSLLGLASSKYAFIVPAWSLDIEIQFYIIAPILLLITKLNKGKAYIIIISLLCPIIGHFVRPFSSEILILSYIPLFIVGGCIYIYKSKVSNQLIVSCLVIAVFIMLLNYTIPFLRNDYLFNKKAVILSFSYQEFINVFLTFLTLPFIIRNVTIRNAYKYDNILSSMSYVIYLLHWPLLQIYSLLVRNVGSAQKVLSILSYYIICIFFSWIVSKYIDVYFEKRRKAWLIEQKVRVNCDKLIV